MREIGGGSKRQGGTNDSRSKSCSFYTHPSTEARQIYAVPTDQSKETNGNASMRVPKTLRTGGIIIEGRRDEETNEFDGYCLGVEKVGS